MVSSAYVRCSVYQKLCSVVIYYEHAVWDKSLEKEKFDKINLV